MACRNAIHGTVGAEILRAQAVLSNDQPHQAQRQIMLLAWGQARMTVFPPASAGRNASTASLSMSEARCASPNQPGI